MNCQQKIINLMTICRKAGKLIIGFDAAKNAVSDGSACCILISEDISDNTLKKIMNISGSIPVIKTGMKCSEAELYFNRKAAVAAVCDKGFARRFGELASQIKD